MVRIICPKSMDIIDAITCIKCPYGKMCEDADKLFNRLMRWEFRVMKRPRWRLIERAHLQMVLKRSRQRLPDDLISDFECRCDWKRTVAMLLPLEDMEPRWLPSGIPELDRAVLPSGVEIRLGEPLLMAVRRMVSNDET